MYKQKNIYDEIKQISSAINGPYYYSNNTNVYFL